jgi:CheY-like chemotaxis protein
MQKNNNSQLAPPNRRAGRIMIIDDEIALASAYGSLLVEEGYTVFLAGGGQKALEMLARMDPPDVILLDCAMPVMSGEEFMKELKRRLPQILETTLVAGFSNFPRGSEITAGFDNEVHCFFQKPNDLQGFLSLVGEVIEKYEELHSRRS